MSEVKLMDFGWALSQLKKGEKLTREGWNGKDMYICLQEGYPGGVPINANTARATGLEEGTICFFLPYIMMKTANVKPTFVPWLASQTDILGEDWLVYGS